MPKAVTQPQTSDIRIEYVPLRALQRWPRNPKEHDLGAMHASVRRFGFVAPIIVDETSGRIVAGHGRLDLLLGMAERGEAPPPRIQVRGDGEWLVPVIRGISFASEGEAEAYLVADNQLTLLGGWDEEALAALLADQALAGTLEGTGFDGDDVDALLRRIEAETAPRKARFGVYPLDTIASEAFQHFRAAGFPRRNLPIHRQMQDINRLAALSGDALLTSTYGHQVADTYHPHRFACHALGMKSPQESFDDDVQLMRAIRLQLDQDLLLDRDYFSMLGLVAGTQACANFRPGVACYYYRRFARPGGIVLDPCTGYGGRLIGWLASLLGGQYVGVDPSVETHEANTRLAQALAPAGAVTLLNQPFEDVDLTPLKGVVDLAFTSPPYFLKERYADEPTQSRVRYPTPEAWQTGFLAPLLRGCFEVLVPGGRCVLNVADVRIKSKTIPLVAMTEACGRDAGFVLETTERMLLGHHFGTGESDESVQIDESESKAEPVLVFKRPS